MPLTLVPPGARIKIKDGKPYPNRFYLVRGELGGRELEVSTKTRDPGQAAAYKARVELEYLERRVPGPHEAVTLGQAAEFYIAWRQPAKGDQVRLRRIVTAIGKSRLVADIIHADLVRAAEDLFPGRKPETKNRWCLKPAAAILHYAAENKWRDWLRIKKLAEGPVRTRAADPAGVRAILAALAAELAAAPTPKKKRLARKKRLLVLWLMKHGNRLSDPLRLLWGPHIDLSRKVYLILIGKGNRWREKPLDEEVFEALANEPEDDRAGRLFPWSTRSGVYNWLTPLTRRLGVTFTPHMARHAVGKRLNAQGEGLKTIMGALDHSDPVSSIRYQDADLAIVRSALNKSGRLAPVPAAPARAKTRGKTSATRRNASR